MDSFGHGFHHGLGIDNDMNEEVDDSEDEDSKMDSNMITIEKLGCKILRKILDYSQRLTDKLLVDEELDVIGILIQLLFNHPNNIDLIIYILDIFGKITKDNADIRDKLLSPEYFDNFLVSLDKWWIVFIESSQKLARSLKYIRQNKILNHLTVTGQENKAKSLRRKESTDSIGVVGKMDSMDRSKSE